MKTVQARLGDRFEEVPDPLLLSILGIFLR